MATRSKMSEGTSAPVQQSEERDATMARHGRLTVDEGVQDRHGTVGDTSVGVDLLEDWSAWLVSDGRAWSKAGEARHAPL